MFTPPSGNSGFDKPFLLLQLAGIVGWVAALLVGRRLPPWSPWPLAFLWLSVVFVVPAYWYAAYPVRNGIEGAGRIMFLVPLVGMNAVLGVVTLVRLVGGLGGR